MAERWQTSEARTAAVFLRDSTGAPATALTPTASAMFKDGTAGAPAATVVEVGSGFYRVTFASAPTKDVLVRVDAGASMTTTRYAALEVPVGGYVDQVDAATTTRASLTGQTAMQADVSTLLGRLSSARSALLDALSNLDTTVSSRASAAALTGLGSPAQASALAALASAVGAPAQAAALGALVAVTGSPAQAAALITAVSTLLAEIDTRARTADVQVTVNQPVAARGEAGP